MVETRSEVSLRAYPNQVDDYLTLELTNENIEQVKLYSLTGQLVRSEVVRGSRVEISVADLPLLWLCHNYLRFCVKLY